MSKEKQTTNQREIPDLPNGWQLASLYQIDDNWYCDLQSSWKKESSVGDSPRGAVDAAIEKIKNGDYR